MEYCHPNVTFLEIWAAHGISQCFMETVTSVTIGGFLVVCGILQIIMYKRHSTEVLNICPSRLFKVQIFFTLFVPMLAVTRFLMQAFLFKGGHIYGHMVVDLITTLIIYPLSAYLIILERRFRIPSGPIRGHGFVLLIFWALVFITENLSFINFKKEGWWWHLRDPQDRLEMSLFVGRYISCMFMFVLGLKAPGIMHQYEYLENDDSQYRTTSASAEENHSTYRNFWSKLRILFPFLWPRKNLFLQVNAVICLLSLIAGRVVNLLVPIYNKKIVDSLSTAPPLLFRWELVLIYVLFKFLQGGESGDMGVLNNLRSFLWIKVQQYTVKELQLELFTHLHKLPLKWHLLRKTGEVMRVMDRGMECIDNLVWYIVFTIIPTMVDILIAVVYFATAFDMWFGLIVLLTMVLYIITTIVVTEWRTKFQRRMNDADNELKARSVDSLLNYETVKYYGAENYEVGIFREAVVKFQKEESKSLAAICFLNTLQNIIMCIGILAGSLLSIYMITVQGTQTVGEFVLFSSYILQLYAPLNWLGTSYRTIQKSFIDMENMFDLIRVEPDVKDESDAPDMLVRNGSVEFRDVTFGYEPERLVLKGINFKVPSGATVALVGPSGAGKSTIMRLLFRFYDVNDGAVLVDGQDVRTVTQASLHANIGVVPQDTVLFSNTIRYNIQYGRLDAPMADVISAAKNADIHYRILSFPDAYDTQVGERGLRLSGGEKQRIAIARTILKDPAIVLLDEATSALDTNTERNIQGALKRVCTNRTTLIIAHRLSTIIHADEILVLKDGEIIERGNHDTLLSLEGIYASMWQQQLESRNGDGQHDDEPDANGDEPPPPAPSPPRLT